METVAMRRRINYLCVVGKVTLKTDLNAKKGACNEARSSEEEHVGMHDIMRKGDFEHSNE